MSSLSLLNATPVWGLNLPGWDGMLPPPAVPAFDGTHRDGFFFDDGGGGGGGNGGRGGTGARAGALGEKIRACTEGGGGHAAFASILWSAPTSESSGQRPHQNWCLN